MKATHTYASWLISRYLDVPRLIAWLSSRQNAPEGGFCGRTNKLVDSCYSLWVGGCWPLIEAVLRSQSRSKETTPKPTGLVANNESLFHREGLIRYIMCCCQDHGKRGGLRDKPSKSVTRPSI
jgi:protein farnesyltransferase subunit beta